MKEGTFIVGREYSDSREVEKVVIVNMALFSRS